jgi:hypothetical protein
MTDPVPDPDAGPVDWTRALLRRKGTVLAASRAVEAVIVVVFADFAVDVVASWVPSTPATVGLVAVALVVRQALRSRAGRSTGDPGLDELPDEPARPDPPSPAASSPLPPPSPPSPPSPSPSAVPPTAVPSTTPATATTAATATATAVAELPALARAAHDRRPAVLVAADRLGGPVRWRRRTADGAPDVAAADWYRRNQTQLLLVLDATAAAEDAEGRYALADPGLRTAWRRAAEALAGWCAAGGQRSEWVTVARLAGAVAERTGDGDLARWAVVHEAAAARLDGNPGRALVLLRHALPDHARWSDPQLLTNLGLAALDLGDAGTAVRLLRTAQRHRAMADHVGRGLTGLALGAAHDALGRTGAAEAAFGDAARHFERCGERELAAEADANLRAVQRAELA